MINLFTNEHRELLSALIKNKVEFMLIGGYAVIHYGYDRNTGDMDIWIKTGNENRNKLILALKAFGIIDEHLKILAEMDFTNPVPVFYFGNEPRRFDFVTMISNVTFEDAIKQVNYISLESLQVPVIHYNHLIASKLTSSRLKDKADIEELERINKYRKK
ncbi:MAG: nucleotidyltransferase [Chitinophagaceae bacterium]|nr:nucleotidyltransferase [Chitinophagaceae bacterium]